jgi:hypothetical protein
MDPDAQEEKTLPIKRLNAPSKPSLTLELAGCVLVKMSLAWALDAAATAAHHASDEQTFKL